MSKKKLSKEDADNAAKALEVLFTTEYISKRELYKQNFIRGIFFSLGSIIGATIIIGALLWVLNLVDGKVPFVDNLKDTLESSQQR